MTAKVSLINTEVFSIKQASVNTMFTLAFVEILDENERKPEKTARVNIYRTVTPESRDGVTRDA